MCGIAAIVNLGKARVDPSFIQSMNRRVVHRGPDSEGIYQEANFSLGHRRLSIIDISHISDQPMCYNGNVITYNGEVYNFPENKKELEKKGFCIPYSL